MPRAVNAELVRAFIDLPHPQRNGGWSRNELVLAETTTADVLAVMFPLVVATVPPPHSRLAVPLQLTLLA